VGANANLRASCAAAALLALASPARADEAPPRAADEAPPRGLELDWSAPSDCPDEDSVRAAVERLVGRRLDPGAATPIYARAFILRPENGRLRLDLSVTEPGAQPHERRVEAQRCAELADAAALIIALAIDPEAGAHDESAQPAPSSRPPSSTPSHSLPPSEPSEIVPPEEPPPETPSERMPSGFALAAVFGIDLGALPAPAPGLGVGGALRFGPNRLDLTATYWFAQRAHLLSRTSAGSDIQLFAANARYCRSFLHVPIDVATCAGFEGGIVHAQGFGVLNPGTGISPWLAPRVDLASAIPLTSHLDLTLDLAILVPLLHDRFVLADLGEVHRTATMTARTLVGLDLHFW